MDWTELNPTVWGKLSAASTQNPNTAAAEHITHLGSCCCYICIFVSKDKSIHLLIDPEVPMQERLTDPKVAGLKLVILQNHLVVGRERQDYIDLRCSSNAHIAGFTEIIREISAIILKEGVPPTKAVNLIIKRWKSFWGKPAEKILSEIEQLGLLGELSVVEQLISLGIPDKIHYWVGPAGNIHDFEFSRGSLEVKVTTRAKHKHVINGLEQLENKNRCSLAVVSFLMERVEHSGTSLPKKVDEIMSRLKDEPDIYEKFSETLAMSGYRFEHRSYYEDYQFIILDCKVFPVCDDFPRLTNEELKTPLSPRITEVKYLLDFDNLLSFSFNTNALLSYLL